MPKIYPLIEGKGEADAVPNLITRILQETDCHDVFVGQVQKANGKGNFTRDNGIERYVERALMRPDCDGVIILLDADDECPLERAFDFASRLAAVSAKCPIVIALANRDFENWFLASIESLRGHKLSDGRMGLKAETPIPSQCENVKGADEFLSRYFPPGINYKKSLDQILLTRLMDLELTRARSRSFQHFCGSVAWLVNAIRANQKAVYPSPLGLKARLFQEASETVEAPKKRRKRA